MLHLKSDYNDTLVDTNEPTRLALQEVSGLAIPPERYTGKDLIQSKALFFPLEDKHGKSAGPRHSITTENWAAAKALIYDGNDFCRWMKPKEGVRENLLELWDMGYTISIVSNCRGISKTRIWRWINFYDMPISAVLVHENPKLAPYSGADIAVDDEFRHLRPFLGHPLVTPILMAAPGATWASNRKDLTVVPDWNGVVEYARALHQ